MWAALTACARSLDWPHLAEQAAQLHRSRLEFLSVLRNLSRSSLAYILDPLVERLSRPGVPRSLCVVVVLALALGLLAMLMLIVLPLLYKETRLLIDKLPGFLDWLNLNAAPWLKSRLDVETVPSAVFELLIGIVTSADGASSSTTVNESVPPASVVTNPLVGKTVIPGASV